MIDYFEDYILLAYRDVIFYLDVRQANIEGTEKSDKVVELSIENSNVKRLDLSAAYKIICISPLGADGSICSVVLEDKLTRQIRFLRIDNDHVNNRLKFVQLGILVNHSRMTISPLLKYRSIGKVEDRSGKRYQVGLVLRENGRIEVYSDFILVNQYFNP